MQVFVRSTFNTSVHKRKLGIKTISLNVKPTLTIMELKRMVHKAGALSSPMEQKLTLAEEELLNSRTIESYNVRECTLIIDQVSWISAKMCFRTNVMVSFVMTDSLERVAEKIRAKVNAHKQASIMFSTESPGSRIFHTLFQLLFQYTRYMDNLEVNSMNHEVVCCLKTAASRDHQICVFVVGCSGRGYTFKISHSDYILCLKYQIHEDLGLENFGLIFAGKQLENDRTFEDYHIQNHSTIHLIYRLAGGGGSLLLYIVTPPDEVLLLNVTSENSVLSVKKEIEERKKYRPEDQVLHFRGMILEDDKIIDDLPLQDYCTIHLSFKPQMGMIKFYAYLPTGKNITLFLHRNETVHRCTKIIQKEMFSRNFFISFGTTILKEGSKLSDYDIQDTVITVVPTSGSLPIELMLHGKTMRQTFMSVNRSDNVLSLRTRISFYESLPIKKLQLFLGDQQLKDIKLLSDYEVRKMITIHVKTMADEAESIQRPSLELCSTDLPMCTGSPESKGAYGTGPYVSRSDIIEQMGACGIGPCATKTGVAKKRQLTIEILMSETDVTDAQLDSKIENGDLYPVAGYFDDVEHYIRNLDLCKSEMADIKRRARELGNQLGIVYALELWKNNTVSPTYRSLINILLHLKHVEVARSICLFLKDISIMI